MEFLKVSDVSKQYINHLALDNVSINVEKGSIFGLLGPNGAGKTTLIRIINRITLPDSGNIILNGNKITDKDIEQIGYLPEERGLYKKMKVGEQALYLSRLKGMSRADALRELKKWFEKFEIQSWWNKKVEELSKGMQQKVQFIITVLHKPTLLIFDEPFSGFDPINTKLLKNEILKLRDEGATIIFSTHNMESVEELCDHIALINKSKKILDGKVNEIKQHYKTNEFELTFSGDFNLLQSTLNPNYKIISHKKQDNYYWLKVKLVSDITTNQLLQSVMPCGNILSFNEVLPKMSDIFIKVVEEQKLNVESEQ
ncbi:MAG: ABC transporter ATP-binding protein [Marinilabiliales bacterium]